MNKEELTLKVEKLIDDVRPYLVADGGNIKFIELTDDMIVKVELQGACHSCPMSKITLKNGVEEYIKKELPEIVSVEAVNI